MNSPLDELDFIDPNVEEFDSTAELIENFVEGFESIVTQFRNNGKVNNHGFESLTIGVLRANGMQWNVEAGLENFITASAKKIYDMIVNFFKSIYNFLFGKEKKIDETQKNFDQIKNKLNDKEILDFDNKDLDTPAGRRVVQLRKLCAKLIDDFKDPTNYIAQMDDVMNAFKGIDDRFGVASEYRHMATVLKEISREIERNIDSAKNDEMYHRVDVSNIISYGKAYVTEYELTFKAMDKYVQGSAFKKLLEGADSALQTKINTFVSKLNKFTQMSAKKMAVLWDVSVKMNAIYGK